ncbi:MAG: hypothetical protein SFT92_04680 [Rickettsiales bacterium]|nr:hypothetical protein [Rickettsiales bacterium]
MSIYLLFGALTLIIMGVLCGPIRQHKTLCAAIIASITLGSVSLYAVLGSPDIVPLLAQQDAKLSAIKEAILKDEVQIKENPNNLEAWIRLGQSFAEAQQWNAAQRAFKQAVVLSGGNPLLILAYAKSIIYGHQGQVTDDAKKALEMVLLQDKTNPEARYFLAVRALQDGHTQEAMQSMKSLYRSLPANSPLKAMIDEQIGRK